MSTRIVDRGWKKIKRELAVLDKSVLYVGILGGVPYAAYIEFGTKYMPARPFMRQTFEQDSRKMVKAIKKAHTGIINGSSAYREITRLGLMYQGFIQVMIRSGSFAPLSEKTIFKKGSDKTLIDSGRMIGAVSFTIR